MSEHLSFSTSQPWEPTLRYFTKQHARRMEFKHCANYAAYVLRQPESWRRVGKFIWLRESLRPVVYANGHEFIRVTQTGAIEIFDWMAQSAQERGEMRYIVVAIKNAIKEGKSSVRRLEG